MAVIEGDHERSIYSISWKKAPGDDKDDRGWLASVSGDGKINVWDLRVCLVLSSDLLAVRVNPLTFMVVKTRLHLVRPHRFDRECAWRFRCQLRVMVSSIWF